jgi:hypothetical protein
VAALIGGGVLLSVLGIGLLILLMSPRNQTVSREERFAELYKQTFTVKQRLFITESESQYYLGNWDSSSVAKVKKGTTLTVHKIVMCINGFAGNSLHVYVTIEDPSFRKFKKLDAQSLLLGDRLAYNDALVQFDPAYLKKDHITSLHMAIQYNDAAATKRLVSEGANVNALNRDGKTPLLYAKNVLFASYLIKQGADVRAQDKEGRTLLHLILEKFYYENPSELRKFVKLLVKNGADVNHLDAEGRSPLMIAAEKQHGDVVQYLLRSGANRELIMRGLAPHYVSSLQTTLSTVCA